MSGDDPFGHFLAETLAAEGVDVWELGFDVSQVPGFRVDSVDRTGARDGFLAGLLATLMDEDFSFDREYVDKALLSISDMSTLRST